MKIPNAQIDKYIENISLQQVLGCLVFGPDEGIISSRCEDISKKIVTDLSDPFTVSNLSFAKSEDDRGKISDEFFSISMLGGRRLIKIRIQGSTTTQITSELKEIEKNIDPASINNDQNFILIEAGDLKKDSDLRKFFEQSKCFAAIACYEDDDNSFKRFVEAEILKQGLNIDKTAYAFLISKLRRNRKIVSMEIAKISCYIGELGQISIKELEDLIGDDSQSQTSDLIDDFISKRKSISLQKFRKIFKNGGNPVGMARFFLSYFEKLYFAKAKIELGGQNLVSVVKSQGLFFKAEAMFQRHLAISTMQQLGNILKNLQKLEEGIKTQKAKPDVLFERFLMN